MTNARNNIQQGSILIIGDAPNSLQLLAVMLRQADYMVQAIVNGYEGLISAQTTLPDLILIDINTPESNGYLVYENLRGNRLTYDIPVIFFSSQDEVINRTKIFRMGVIDCFTKPFQLEEISLHLINHLENRREQKQLQKQNALLQQEIQKHILVGNALKRSNSLLQAQNEASIAGILAVDEQGCIVNYNRRFCEMWQISEELLIAIGLDNPLRAILKKLELPETLITAIENTYDCPDESNYTEIFLNDSRVFDCYSAPVISSEQRFYGRIWNFYDSSDRVQAQRTLQIQKDKSERLLRNIFPEPIVERLKQNQPVFAQEGCEVPIADAFDEVTVLFADIVGFTEISASISPKDVVGLLNRIFFVFDHLAEKYNLEKIKTIGDAYMVVGGLPFPHPNHAEAIADMALDMQAEISLLKTYEGKSISLRIGINTGAVIAGVIGNKRFGYDLWGDAVNVASRMEAYGEAGKIQVTEATYLQLQDKYKFAKRGAIAVKGKGEMVTYWLTGKKSK